jgi:hypothetical protein
MKLLKTFIGELGTSFKKIWQNLNYTALCCVLDALFFFLYGAVSSFFWVRIQAQLYSIAQYLMQDSSYLVGITSNPIFKPYLSQILKYSLMLVGCIYVIYIIVQGSAWFMTSRKILHHKAGFWNYFGKFALFSLFYFIIVIIAVILSLRYSFATLFEHEGTAAVVFLIAMAVVFYFMLVSYSLILKHNIKDAFKKTFWLGTKKAHLVLLMYAVLVIIAVILNFLLDIAAKLHPAAMIIGGVILLLPFLTLARVYVTEVVGRIDEKHREHNTIRTKKKVKKK